ncbi:Tsc3p NDAI_0A07420 [Naumovozyma dairenensis CBS 421]|uniref:Uncharacterized protein n=1 Tax=Naumovozyma dairenensis (strain ATCC 10597 / BCRC 20456 / CBS 421 / NBRC 0211 / NRRL Y-12639) TaxID=1071378 RepID=G0W508_NAUDC|nr:hypothetical protein NDAI_0A07420 [Naumovozyma dairenensis CBS 421]CCD22896.1 hypothetical protein NDAI_0A07420 [Naumovozyma dairenensis CBS 421]
MSETVSSSTCTMTYVPTNKEIKEKRRGVNGKASITEKIEEIVEKLYWMYYIHLPYYLMTSFDSFCLHVFFLTIFSLSVFGVIKYCFL